VGIFMKFLNMLIVILIVATTVMIFKLSDQMSTDSDALSRSFTIKLVQLVQDIVGEVDEQKAEETVKKIHKLVRKYAHFVLYTLLGVVSGLLFAVAVYREFGLTAWVSAWIFCVIYAISDEYHQTFIAGRSGELRDVLIDSSGALLGTLAVILIGRAIAKRRRYRMYK